jgi:tetratricopeptide (TPR) repeat protein
MAALEDAGMECVSDYVQSTTNALKRPMFLRAAEAFTALKTLRPADASLEAKALFCQGRAHVAANEFPQAIQVLKRSLAIEPDFACSHNALGVALARTGQNNEARAAFETAAKLTPSWALPPLQIAQQLINAGDLRGAVPHLENAAKLNPKAIGIHWSLARVHRLLGNAKDFARVANSTIAIDRNYAPIYSELGQFYESVHDPSRAAQAYESYLVLAPNFADSTEVRKRLQGVRPPAPAQRPRRTPTLRRDGDK